ncbi:hypothetical protein ACLIMR_16350, partial [Enterococcus faecium]
MYKSNILSINTSKVIGIKQGITNTNIWVRYSNNIFGLIFGVIILSVLLYIISKAKSKDNVNVGWCFNV